MRLAANDTGRLYIVGAGGIGCAVGHALGKAGARPIFIETNAHKIDWGNRHGMRLGSAPAVPATFRHFDDWQPQAGDVVLLCTKCYDNDRVAARLPRDVTLLPIQNGFDPALSGHLGEGIASFVSECHPRRPYARLTRRGLLHLGPRGHASANGHAPATHASVIHSLCRWLRRHAQFGVRIVDDILPFKYTKLLYNAAMSPLAAAAGLDNGQLLFVRQARHLFFDLLRENHAILAGAGLRLATIGPFHPNTVQHLLRRPLLTRLLTWLFYPTLRGSYCSMVGDLPRGRTEIDYYNGHLIALAGDRPCPLNRGVLELVKRMQTQRIKPHRDMLKRIV